MGKISGKVSKGLGAAIAEAQAKMGGTTVSETVNLESFPGEHTVEAILNSGVEAQKKRKRRTKAEMEAARQAEAVEKNSLFETFETTEEEPRPKNHEEFCERELQKAHDRGLPEPDFDFRAYYEKGQRVYFVRVLEKLGIKEIKHLYLRSIYPRMMVGSEDKAGCHCIGYNERDQIFFNERDAKTYWDSVKVSAKYADEPKSRRKRFDSTDEEVEDEEGLNEAYTSLEEALSEDE